MPNNKIHSTAIIDNNTIIGNNVEIGPYCVIGPDVKIGNNVILKSHIVIEGITEIGDNTIIYPFASIGTAPQDLKYSGEQSKVIIGKNNTIREYVTINPGTQGGNMITRIGDNCLLMINVHVAHDCIIGNNVIMANNATLAGHVTVGDYAIIGGLTAVHQFVRIGAHAMIGGMSPIERDVIPYGVALGERATLEGINIVGLKRRNFDRETINIIRECYKILFENNELNLSDKLSKLSNQYGDIEEVKLLLDFIETESNRTICTPKVM